MNINSLDNKKVKEWVKLQQKKYRDENSVFLIETEHLVDEALSLNYVKEIITCNEDKKFDINTYYVTEQIMKKISSHKSIPSIIAVCKKIEERDIKGNVILLDNIQDPGNLGTIIRSAVAFNIDTIVLSLDSVDLYNEKVVRASEGMIFKINIIRKDIIESLQELKSKNYHLYKTDVNGGTNIKNINFKNNCAVVIGNEGQGISDEVKAFIDDAIYIPMSEACESLNAGVSASIIMYEMSEKNE